MWSVITCRCYSVHSCRRQCSATGLMCRRGTAKTDRTVTSHRSLSRELLFHSLSLQQQQQQQQQLHPSTSGPSICHDCWSIGRCPSVAALSTIAQTPPLGPTTAWPLHQRPPTGRSPRHNGTTLKTCCLYAAALHCIFIPPDYGPPTTRGQCQIPGGAFLYQCVSLLRRMKTALCTTYCYCSVACVKLSLV